jgi:hypothetical protein
MRRLSSKTTFFNKRVFPVIWFGFVALFVIAGLAASVQKRESPPLEFVIVPVLMAVFGYVIMKQLVLDLMDEVWDAGDALLVRNNKQEDRILLSNIVNVSYVTFMNPPRITLTLRQPCRFGKEITFSPPVGMVAFFSKSPIVTELIERIDATRRGR